MPTSVILRLCRKNMKHLFRYKYSTAIAGSEGVVTRQNNKLDLLCEKYKDKILFNSYLDSDKLQLGYYKYYIKLTKQIAKQNIQDMKNKTLEPLPVALKYVVDKERLLEIENDDKDEVPEGIFQLPFGKSTKVTKVEQHESTETALDHTPLANKWMTAYEHFDDSILQENENSLTWSNQYGTPDPTMKVSSIPCGGCGALLHCSEPSIPGYIPSEIFKNASVKGLCTTECQRCHFLKEYNVALDVSVEQEEYEKLLQFIREVKSLVIVMVDLLDFPCSLWPGIVDIIGTNRPLFIVANKVDLLPGDSIGYLKRVEQSLKYEISKTKLSEANIKYISLISAKTGYGVEELISAMFKLWLYKGDVFLTGCTNVGKSSLFNALLQSDYCKVHVADIIQRATVSRWPGTTLNLLKFPINRPSAWKIHLRTQRLISDAKLLKYEDEIRSAQKEEITTISKPSIISHIGQTFSDPNKEYADDMQSRQFNLNNKLYAKSKWFYDTPGVINPDQVLSLLTTEELLKVIPATLIRPQTYYLHKGSSILVAGLARIDFVECTEPCRFTVFCSRNLPITVVTTAHADEVYQQFLGTDLLAVPTGSAERLQNWPGLQKHTTQFQFVGQGPKKCCGDIVLSSVAWVAVTAKQGSVCKVDAWTPEARGIHDRIPSLLPYAVNLKGKRIRDTPAYMLGNIYTEE